MKIKIIGPVRSYNKSKMYILLSEFVRVTKGV